MSFRSNVVLRWEWRTGSTIYVVWQDARFSGGTHGFVVGHITPEAFEGGPLALVKNGDVITIDARKRTLTLDIPARELAARRRKWRPRKGRYTRGVLAKYSKLVSTASKGAVNSFTRGLAAELEAALRDGSQEAARELLGSLLGRSPGGWVAGRCSSGPLSVS